MAAYAEGELSEQESDQFERDLATDPVLAAEWRAYRAAVAALPILGMEQLNDFPAVKPPFWKRSWFWWVVGILGVGIAIGILLSQKPVPPDTPQAIAEAYYRTPILEYNRTAAETSRYQRAAQSFLEGQYQQTIDLLVNEDLSDEERFLLGHAYYRNDQSEESLPIWRQLQSTAAVFREEADWMEVLSQLDLGEVESAVEKISEIRQDSDHAYRDLAEEILQAMSDGQ